MARLCALLLALAPVMASAQPRTPSGLAMRVEDPPPPWTCNDACAMTAFALVASGIFFTAGGVLMGTFALLERNEFIDYPECWHESGFAPCTPSELAERANDVSSTAAFADVMFGILLADGIGALIFTLVVLNEQATAQALRARMSSGRFAIDF